MDQSKPLDPTLKVAGARRIRTIRLLVNDDFMWSFKRHLMLDWASSFVRQYKKYCSIKCILLNCQKVQDCWFYTAYFFLHLTSSVKMQTSNKYVSTSNLLSASSWNDCSNPRRCPFSKWWTFRSSTSWDLKLGWPGQGSVPSYWRRPGRVTNKFFPL